MAHVRMKRQQAGFLALFIVVCLAATGCAAPEPVISDDMLVLEGGDLPVDLSGSWAMDYARSDNVNDPLREATYQIRADNHPDRQRDHR